jgi:hypothetical protein
MINLSFLYKNFFEIFLTEKAPGMNCEKTYTAF